MEPGDSMLPIMLPMVPELPLERIEAGDEFCGVPDLDLKVREPAPTELGGEGYAKRDISNRGGCYVASVHTIHECCVDALLTANLGSVQYCLLPCAAKFEDVTRMNLKRVKSGV